SRSWARPRRTATTARTPPISPARAWWDSSTARAVATTRCRTSAWISWTYTTPRAYTRERSWRCAREDDLHPQRRLGHRVGRRREAARLPPERRRRIRRQRADLRRPELCGRR